MQTLRYKNLQKQNKKDKMHEVLFPEAYGYTTKASSTLMLIITYSSCQFFLMFAKCSIAASAKAVKC